MQTLSSEEVLDLPTAKTLQHGIHKVPLDSLDTVKPLVNDHLLNSHPCWEASNQSPDEGFSIVFTNPFLSGHYIFP